MARFLACGDSALTVELGQGISPEINARVTALSALISEARLPGVRELVPAYCSLTVQYDPEQTSHTQLTAAPRLQTPRVRIPAGSVGIAGEQTGVYPIASPGGWQIIGRTPLRLFDPQREQPFLLSAGQKVRFVPIDEAEYRRLGGSDEPC